MNTATTIANEVSRVTGVPVREILACRRDATTVVARHMCIMLMREFTEWGMPTIGRALNLYDHSTVLHAIRSWPARERKNPLAGKISVARLAVAARLAKQRDARRVVAEANGYVVA